MGHRPDFYKVEQLFQAPVLIGWGLLVKKDGEEVYRAKGNDIPVEALKHRNVAGEIFGILKSLQWCQAQGITKVTLYYDYQGLESWATGAWRETGPLDRKSVV